MVRPWWLLYRRYLHRPLARFLRVLLFIPFWLLKQGARGAGWLFVRPVRLFLLSVRRRWRAGYPRRARWRREQRSRLRVWQARVRVTLRRPQPPRKAIIAPAVPRVAAQPRPRRRMVRRLATTGLAAGLIVAATLMTSQQAPRLRGAAAENEYQISSSKFVTVTPTSPAPAATATASATPTAAPTRDPLNGGGSVLFTLRQEGNSDIYALSVGQSERCADRRPGRGPRPAGPDGERLPSPRAAMATGRSHPAAEGRRVRRLTHDDAFDGGLWSPDGQWLVRVLPFGNLDIYLISADSTQAPAPDAPGSDFRRCSRAGGTSPSRAGSGARTSSCLAGRRR